MILANDNTTDYRCEGCECPLTPPQALICWLPHEVDGEDQGPLGLLCLQCLRRHRESYGEPIENGFIN
jgi:hypothetical protein